MFDKRERMRARDADATYRSWLLKRLVTLLVVAAIALGGLHLLARSGETWAAPYDLVGWVLTELDVGGAGD